MSGQTNNTAPRPDFTGDLTRARDSAWSLIARGVTDRRFAFHTPTVASIAEDGAPALRTVVLRACDPARRLVRFHTDLRSRKAAELARDPRAQVHFYDPGMKVQIRLAGLASVKPIGAGGRDAWDGSRMASRACYAIVPGPGAAIDGPDAYRQASGEREILAGDVNFAAVEIVAHELDWVHLHAAGHRRARFRWDSGSAAWNATWLAP